MNARTASFRKQRWLPFAVLIIGLAATATVTALFWRSADDRYVDRRTLMTEEVAASIEFRMTTYVQSLQGARALFEASDEVTAADFSVYVESIDVFDELPGMQAMGWNRLLAPEDAASYEQLMRERNPSLPDSYAVRPITTDELMVVEYIVPIVGNELAFGFNIYSEERRAAAIDLSRAKNSAAATAPVSLVQDDEEVPGILVLLPTMRDGVTDGAVVAVFRTGDLLAAAASDIGRSFSVQDLGGVSVADSEPTLLSAPSIATDAEAHTEIEIYGRRWLVSLGSDNLAPPTHLGLMLGAAASAAFALALAWLVHATQRTAELADRKAALLTLELSETNHKLGIVGTRLERGMRSADVLVWESNLSTGGTWSSAGIDHRDAGIEDSLLERIHPDDLAEFEALPAPEPGKTREHQFRLADKHGTYRWILSRSQGVLRNGNHVIIGAHIDVTEQRKRTDLVVSLNDDLINRNQALRDFTHVASHDLRSPLRAVGSLVGFLREDLPADLAADVQHHLTRIDERVARMSQLIDDLLVYASAHNSEGRVEMVIVSEIVQEILDTIEIPADIITIVDCDFPAIPIAKTPFSMCVRNLLDNALKHHDKPNGQVAVKVHEADGYVHLAVSDNGPGIEAAYLPKIFEPFRRLRSDEKTPGSGIGLSVIERATAAHGAHIEVDSVVGEGSTFTIVWPINTRPVRTSDDLLQLPSRS